VLPLPAVDDGCVGDTVLVDLRIETRCCRHLSSVSIGPDANGGGQSDAPMVTGPVITSRKNKAAFDEIACLLLIVKYKRNYYSSQDCKRLSSKQGLNFRAASSGTHLLHDMSIISPYQCYYNFSDAPFAMLEK
jgi:hypothetical protein